MPKARCPHSPSAQTGLQILPAAKTAFYFVAAICKILKIFSRAGQTGMWHIFQKDYWDLILNKLHKLNKKMSVQHGCNICKR